MENVMGDTKAKTVSLAEICKKTNVPREMADRLFFEIIEQAVQGNEVSIVRVGKFYTEKVPGREMKIPSRPGSSEQKTHYTEPTLRLRFRATLNFREYLRRRTRGRAKGI